MEAQSAHEAQKLPLRERIDYLMVVASMVGADVVLDLAELEQVRSLCKSLAIPEADAEGIVEAAKRPSHLVHHHVEALRTSQLKFALLTDCIGLAYADGEYVEGERQGIAAVARELEVTPEQLAALEEAYRTLHAAEIAQHYKEGHGASAVANKLAAVGIPFGVAGGLSAFGLSAAGVATGAGAVVMGLGIAGAFGAVLGAGLGTVVGVRWLHDKLANRPG